ncbi:probable disease resistance protein At4g27220 [Argentina anserina]|uniref:probable disease resistance protein At4g27220 n=1 Tax=Argentina anserina TaxID=57926 RepID=UPI00217676F7|nr:probable disease resistance protein At4g27220 [Potentilla anserina]XP_050364187.1 probable disease resistance protein At4g27220 [Potentilla anserina]XP_050364188.1 probable disease resistance protein At4g27220 [Potentilla anserina]XP_050364189.1 probable disease resistance protein At4g27220 [Potentilla anserina]
MGEIVLGILGPVMQLGEWIWTPVKCGMSYMVHYKRNLQSLEDPAQKLETMLSSHRESVDIAEMNGDRIRPEVQTWLIDAAKAMTHVAELNGEAEKGDKCFKGWCPDLKWRYNLGKKALKLTTTINKLVKEGEFQTFTLEVRRAPYIHSSISTEGFEAFEATRQAMDRVMDALNKNEVITISVYGMGGIGKTTLVKQVGAQVCRDELFDRMIMVVFSQNPVVMQIQDQLKDMLALNLHETTEMARAAKLRERIMRENKILIILDDIWDSIDLSIIGIPSPDELGRCGSKVILTTRRFNVCINMGNQVMIPLSRLSEEDSWTLFAKNVKRSFESENICEVAKQVTKECGGLPVALIAVARALGDKDQLEEWQQAAQQLEISQPATPDDDGHVLKCIRLSYDYLKSEDAKSCFLLCCLFPEDYDIPIEDLIKYGLGKGLFRDAATLEESRSRACSVINYLKSSSLLLESRWDEFVRMHDVIRDVAMLIAACEYGDRFLVKAGTGITVWPSNAYDGHSAISLMKNDLRKLPEELVCPKLQILLLQHNYNIEEIPETIFESFSELKVLDLSHTGISILPHSLILHTNIQALYLDVCRSIRNVSVLGQLKKLEILSMRCSYLEKLPEEIGNLGKLRMLDLTGSWYIKRIPSNLISRLSRLEELYMQGSFKEWGSKIEAEGEETNVGFDELIGLSYLNILNVDIIDRKCLPHNASLDPNWKKFKIYIRGNERGRLDSSLLEVGLESQNKVNSRVLVLNRTINSLPGWFNNAVTQRVQKLKYTDCKDLNNILVEVYNYINLPTLEFLVIRNCNQVVTLIDTGRGFAIANKPVFENLELLCLACLDNMIELCLGELPQGSLGKLKHLSVGNCGSLLNPAPSNLLQRLHSLETFYMRGLTSARYVFQSEEQIELQKFRELRLFDLPQMENIWIGPVGYAIFRNLQYMEVGGCNKLKYVFTTEVSQSLLQLRVLLVRDCSCLEMIIGAGKKTIVDKIVLPHLNHLHLINLPQFTSFYTENNEIECPSLQALNVYDCPQFRHLNYNFHGRNPVKIDTR